MSLDNYGKEMDGDEMGRQSSNHAPAPPGSGEPLLAERQHAVCGTIGAVMFQSQRVVCRKGSASWGSPLPGGLVSRQA